ncbi:hypothetical protein [Geomicrobium sp. JCM 19039]|uniref:hypothetical protein n=1 Tax=Geomicrobium sp. JCM 19039 TaxID=1460636 RepID=UPI0005A9B386|nr:hypothetical protein [Geomicrobium sp. JCM 19039]
MSDDRLDLLLRLMAELTMYSATTGADTEEEFQEASLLFFGEIYKKTNGLNQVPTHLLEIELQRRKELIN